MSATVRFSREDPGPELRRGAFDVSLDGIRVGSIERHETVELSIEPGRHSLRVSKGRYRSRDHFLDVGDGDGITFRCHGTQYWPLYLASILKKDLAIALRRTT